MPSPPEVKITPLGGVFASCRLHGSEASGFILSNKVRKVVIENHVFPATQDLMSETNLVAVDAIEAERRIAISTSGNFKCKAFGISSGRCRK